MANVFDYVKWRGDIPFNAMGFCDVDALALTEMSYIDYDDVECCQNGNRATFEEVAKEYFSKHTLGQANLGAMVPAQIITLFDQMSKAARYKDCVFSDYENITDLQNEEQFSAITITFGDTVMVAFRGTDDTIVGWQENFNMAFMTPVPAQVDAKKYLDKIGKKAKNIIVSGHSKGGNLSVYAATECVPSVKKKITKVYNLDGPGFKDDFFSTKKYGEICDRVTTIVPKESVVGMLLVHGSKYNAVDSEVAGILQHNGLTWKIMGGDFERVPDVSGISKLFDKSFSNWVLTMSTEERQDMVEVIFGSLFETSSITLSDLTKRMHKLLGSYLTIDPKKRKFFEKEMIKLITDNVMVNIVDDVVKPRVDGVKRDIKNATGRVSDKAKKALNAGK